MSANKIRGVAFRIDKIPYLYFKGFGFRILTHRTRASSLAIDGIEGLRPKSYDWYPQGQDARPRSPR